MSSAGMNDELTPKEILFCKKWLVNGNNGTQAAIEAGATEANAANWASETLKKPYIQQFLRTEMERITEKLDLTVEYIFSKLKDCIELSLIEENGKKTLLNHNALLGACQEVSKMKGYYKQSQEVEQKFDEMNKKLNDLIEQNKKDY